MKSEKELLQILYDNLAELQDGRVKKKEPEYAKQLKIELALLYNILGDDVDEEYREIIEDIILEESK